MSRRTLVFVSSNLLFSTNLVHADINTGLDAHYNFDDCLASDSSGMNRNGTIFGNPTCIDGRMGKALHFAGNPDYIETGYSQTNLQSYSISTWIYLLGNNEGGVILQNRGEIYGGGTSMTLMTTTTISNNSYPTRFIAEGDNRICGMQTNVNVNDGRWHHLVGTWSAPSRAVIDESQFSLFVDGNAIDTTVSSGTIYSPINGIGTALIGYHEVWNNYFKGAIDDVRIYNRVLSATDIQELYLQGSTRQLTITKQGTGSGIVTSNPIGINCGAVCSANFAHGSAVTLIPTPTPANGSVFGGFSGDPDCNDRQLTMNAAKSCVATFILPKPIAVTKLPTNITETSVTLNGTVTSASETATTSFDFGSTVAYGENINAVPAQIYSSSAVPITAMKSGLTCDTEYNYRAKAVSNNGIGLGSNQLVTTAACVINAWLNPPNPIIVKEKDFILDVIVDSSNAKVGSFAFAVSLDTNKLELNTSYQNASGKCNHGVCPGDDALDQCVVISDATDSSIIIACEDDQGVGPSNDLQVLTMHLKTKLIIGNTPIDFKINTLLTIEGNPIGQNTKGAIVNVSPGLCGDTDGNGTVNIVDALAIARNLIGLPPPPTVSECLANVNENGRIDITDALFIARHSVGLIVPPEACDIGQPVVSLEECSVTL